jgi:hypothetical protein
VCEKEAGGEGKEDRAHYYTADIGKIILKVI